MSNNRSPKIDRSSLIGKLKDRDYLFIGIFAAFLIFGLMPYYKNGNIILGGEGNYVIDFGVHLKKFAYTWYSVYGHGVPNIWASGTGANIIALRAIEKITQNASFVNFVLVFSIYFAPFLFMYWAVRLMKGVAPIAFLIGAFYCLNPFCLYYFLNLNQWNAFSLAAMPLYLALVLKFFKDHIRLFFYSLITSLFLSFAFTNTPTAVIIHFSMVVSIVVAGFCFNERFVFLRVLKKYAILLSSFLLANIWWILAFIFGAGETIKKIYTPANAASWLNTTVEGHGAIVAKMFALTTIIPRTENYDFYSYIHNLFPSKVIALIPALLVFGLAFYIKDKTTKKNVFVMLVVLLTTLFFLKGPSGLFGFIYTLFFSFFPFFYIFKTPVEKFGLLYIFIFTILIFLILNAYKNNKRAPAIFGLFVLYLVFCSVPVLSGNLINNVSLGAWGHCTRKYSEKDSYRIVRKILESCPAQNKILSMPGMGNYQVCLSVGNKIYYTGLDPLLMNTSKAFYASQNQIDGLYKSIYLPDYIKLLGFYNIGTIIVNEDLIPWFDAVGPNDAMTIERVLNASRLDKYRQSNIVLYFNNGPGLRPLVYTTGVSLQKDSRETINV